MIGVWGSKTDEQTIFDYSLLRDTTTNLDRESSSGKVIMSLSVLENSASEENVIW